MDEKTLFEISIETMLSDLMKKSEAVGKSIDPNGELFEAQEYAYDKILHKVASFTAEVARLRERVAELERNAKWIEAHPQGTDALNFTVFTEDELGNWRCCSCLEEWWLLDEATPQENNWKYCPACGSAINACVGYKEAK